jgi:Fur family ferric uptake transcriptional regulator
MQSDQLIKKAGLSLTEARKLILDIFISSPTALSHNDIENLMPEGIDRVTVYRTLQTFVQKGIVHHVPTTDNTILYALCKEECQSGHHHDNHVHFLCTSCQTTNCLEEVTVPLVRLPNGFQLKKAAMVIEGICDACNN